MATSTGRPAVLITGCSSGIGRPHTRYLINPVAKSVVTLNRVLPGRAYDALLRRQYKLPS